MKQDQQNIALLKSKLEMPLIVRDFLLADKKPDSSANYALHDMLGAMHPCEALLCACLSAREIISFENIQSADLKFLENECRRITKRYAERIIMAEENPELWEKTQINMMHDLNEDLESFTELLELCYMSYEITSPKAAHFLGILITQLHSQIMIVDEVMKKLDQHDLIEPTLPTHISETRTNNIVPFPVSQ